MPYINSCCQEQCWLSPWVVDGKRAGDFRQPSKQEEDGQGAISSISLGYVGGVFVQGLAQGTRVYSNHLGVWNV